MKKVFKTKFGSHLYGTDTPNSDLDYKGIFKAPLSDIVLGRETQTIFENNESKSETGRNNPDAVDCEWIELRRFIKDCLAGQTYALDMLFSPSNLWEESSKEWSSIIENRSKLLSKNVKPYIGYCRQQANKYGLKGSRLGELIRLLNWLKTLPLQDQLIKYIDTFEQSEFVWREQKDMEKNGKITKQDFLVVLEKRFPVNAIVKKMIDSLDGLFSKYGSRAIEAERNNGVDWKAVSHAFRCMYQLEELAETGQIIFPLKDKDFLRDIKLGKIDWNILNDKLYSLMEITIKKVEESKLLPDEPNRNYWNEWIVKDYLK